MNKQTKCKECNGIGKFIDEIYQAKCGFCKGTGEQSIEIIEDSFNSLKEQLNN